LREKYLPRSDPISERLPVPGKKSAAYLWKDTVRTRLDR
jgi:hypothetical protein